MFTGHEGKRVGAKEKERLVETFQQRFSESSRAKEPYVTLGSAAYKYYRSHIDKTRWPFPSKVFEPYLFSTIRAIVAARKRAIFGNPVPWEFSPEGTQGDVEEATDYNTLSRFHWRESRPRAKVDALLTGTGIWGTSYALHGWDYCERARRVLVAKPRTMAITVAGPDGMPATMHVNMGEQLEEVIQSVAVRDNASFWPLHFLESFPDPGSPTVAEGEYFIHRTTMSEGALKEKAESYDWDMAAVKEAIEECGSSGVNAEAKSAQDLLNQVGFGSGLEQASGDRKWFEVSTMWGLEFETVFVNRRVVYHDHNRFRHGLIPVTQQWDYKLDGEHFGMSLFEITQYVLRGLQTFRNSAASEAMMRVFTPLLVRRGSPVINDIKNVGFKPKAVWRTRGNPAEEVMPFPAPLQGIQVASGMAQEMKSASDQASAMQDAARGGLPDGNPKATTVQTAMQAGSVRLEDLMGDWDEQFTLPAADFQAENLKQFERPERMVGLTEDPETPSRLVRLDDERRQRKWNVRAASAIGADKLVAQKRLLEILEIAGKIGATNFDPDGGLEAAVELVDARMKERIILTPERKMQKAEEQMRMASEIQRMQMQLQPPQQPALPGGDQVVSEAGIPQDSPTQEMAADMAGAAAL